MESSPRQSVRQFSFDDFMNNFAIIKDALAENKNISIMVRREENLVFLYFKRAYDDEVEMILADAKAEYHRKNAQGYTHEQAFKDFMEAQEEISKQFAPEKYKTELIFSVEEAAEGGFIARALGASIFTEADTLSELQNQIRDAVQCHFDEDQRPKLVRLHFVREDVIAV